MNSKQVTDLMVPLSEYVTVSKDATLGEAVAALEKARTGLGSGRHGHRAVLIFDKQNRIVGKVNFLATLRALEPKYDELISDSGPWHVGFTRKFQKAMFESLKLWRDPMEKICKKAAKVKVRTFMTIPRESEMIEFNAPLGEAIHQLVIGHHQSLLVTKDRQVVGVLRLADAYQAVADAILACGL